MDKYERKRSALKGRVTSLKTAFDVHPTIPLDEIQASNLLKRVEKCIEDNNEIYEKIVDLCASDADIPPHELLYNAEDLRLQTMKNALMKILKTLSTSSTATSSTSQEVRLPRLELPSFSGNRLDWLSFHDLFRAAVHNNTQLSGAQKLQYLKSSVKGEAATLIQAFILTDDNYDEAWKTLEARYQDKRELVNQHFDRLLSIPNLQTENPAVLQKLFDRAKECFRAVEILTVPKETAYELIIIHLLSKKLDPESRLQWERALKKNSLPSFQEFCDFGDHQSRVTAAARSTSTTKKVHDNKQGAVVHHGSTRPPSSSCKSIGPLCNEDHKFFQCKVFKAMTVNERWKVVKSKQLCFNCLSSSHRSEACKSSHCKYCEKYHHSLLHNQDFKPKSSISIQPPPEESSTAHFVTHNRTKGLLSTALIRIKGRSGEFQLCRALLDNGSESSFVTSSCATRLGLRRTKVQVPLSGLAGADAGTSKELVELTFSSCHGFDPIFKVNALILKSITRDIPSTPLNSASWKHLEGLILADPHFDDKLKIDVLLGADIFYDLLEADKKTGPSGTPIAIKTALGWILGGNLGSPRPENPSSSFMVQCDSEATLKRFWELEEVPRKIFLTKEEKACEEHFASTHSRNDKGRFIVRLPMRNDSNQLGESRDIAVRRLKSGERKNLADPLRQKIYQDVMEEYLQLGHMEVIPDDELQNKPHYYMPHHAVENLASSTTPFRLVYDASATTSSGVSLNQILMVGPKRQDNLVVILIRFRNNKIAIVADIPKMYRQILVNPADVDFQRIVWRRNPTEPIRDYRLLTATFGTASAPYLAIRSLQELAKSEEDNFPEAAAVIQRDFYVDDLISGAPSDEEVLKLQPDLMTIMSRGGMSLKKWASNSASLMSTLPPELKETVTPLPIEEDTGIKTLGLQWHPSADYFSFKVALSTSPSTTKRTVLSEISKVFDPLGWLSPVTITAKIFMQRMWKEDLGWDEELPSTLQAEWLRYRDRIPLIQNLTIPRFINQDKPILQQLHGFCDASEAAFAAVVFLRSINREGDVVVRMVAAKSKVAPVKQVTIPRLELCGAVLLVRLMQCVKEALNVSLDGVFGWTDSTIVLSWLASPPHRWKTFVANRVAEIQESIPYDDWKHVKSEENPADCASRGICHSALADQDIWWQGPKWLSDSELPFSRNSEDSSVVPPEEKTIAKVLHIAEDDSLLFRYSDLSKLLRITTYCQRAINWMRRGSAVRPISHMSTTVTTGEIDRALMTWVKIVQQSEFPDDIRSLQKKKSVPANSRLLRLSVFLDEDGILRVGGRLRKADIREGAKHQIILPKKHHLTDLIISHQHNADLHTGPQALLASLQQKYWIVAGRDVVRNFVRKCVKCCRFRAQCAQQKMGDLPAARITPASPFHRTGVDYAGPYSLTARKGRGQRSVKSYISLFVCLVTRAIHFELVSDLTTEAFLAAFRRFIARRGKPTDVFSDCGTNFIGAKKILDDYQTLFTSSAHNTRLKNELATDYITWHFSPPSGPTFGGLWESGVISMKHHLQRVVGVAILTTEEMMTLLAQVEAVLNSRPITELSSDPSDLQPLTPGHFLIGRPLTALKEPELTHLKEGHLSRWQRVQQMFQHFWRRWSTEYLTRLQQRNKWQTGQVNVEIGSIVLIKDENLPPAQWSLGRIISTFPGEDNLVRVVTVKTATSEFKRPITKLCILPIS